MTRLELSDNMWLSFHLDRQCELELAVLNSVDIRSSIGFCGMKSKETHSSNS